MELPKNQVRNPLTIIAIFAGISEISGTAVIPFLSSSLQIYFIWFVMGFPILLVSLFFVVLIKKHHVLYAPSDYKSDDAFTDLAVKISTQSVNDIKSKNEKEFKEIEIETKEIISETKVQEKQINKINSAYYNAMIAEKLGINQLISEYGDQLQPNRVIELQGERYNFDAIIENNNVLLFFEIKYFSENNRPLNGIKRLVDNYTSFFNQLSGKEKRAIGLYIVIIADVTELEADKMQHRIKLSFIDNKPIVNFRVYSLSKLKNEFGMEKIQLTTASAC